MIIIIAYYTLVYSGCVCCRLYAVLSACVSHNMRQSTEHATNLRFKISATMWICDESSAAREYEYLTFVHIFRKQQRQSPPPTTFYHRNRAVKVYYINSYLHFEMCWLLSPDRPLRLRHRILYIQSLIAIYYCILLCGESTLVCSADAVWSEHAHRQGRGELWWEEAKYGLANEWINLNGPAVVCVVCDAVVL